jgi:imidazolonepropionase-like amidohydrolase
MPIPTNSMRSSMLLLENVSIFDGIQDVLLEDHHLLIEGDLIREVSDTPIKSPSASKLDLKGCSVMPGLIDAHVHVTDWGASPAELISQPPSYTAIRSARNLKSMLLRGFTTVRDACGADFGLARAVDQGLIESPRLFFVGKALSATGGHGDFRVQGDDSNNELCGCADRGLSVIVDGEPAVRQAARNELRKGAHAIKIMASGGVASPTDPIANLQFSEAEIRAIVEEASFWGSYVMAHAYTAAAIKRCLEFGVRSIEHGNLIDAETASLAKDKDAFVVPTLITYAAMSEKGADIGLPQHSIDKLADVSNAGLQSLEYLKAAGTRTGFGTDLFGALQSEQSRELLIRAEVDSIADVLRSATSENADLLNMTGKLGCIKPGAFADLLILEGNPLADLSLLQDQGKHIKHIVKAGQIVDRSSKIETMR